MAPVIHISEAQAAGDFASVLARVRAGAEVVIETEGGKLPVAVIHQPALPRRTISECIALLPEDSAAVMDADFAKDSRGGHREPPRTVKDVMRLHTKERLERGTPGTGHSKRCVTKFFATLTQWKVPAVALLLLVAVYPANCARTITRDRIQVDTPYGPLLLSDVTLVQDSSSDIGWSLGQIAFKGTLTNDTDRAWTSLVLSVAIYDKHKHRLPESTSVRGLRIDSVAKGDTRTIEGTIYVVGDGLADTVRKIESFDVEWSPASSFRWTYVLSLQSPTKAKDLNFEDALTRLRFSVDDTQISFVMKNKTDSSLSVVWDQASIVDLQQISHRAIHSGTKFFKKEASQIPTTIPPGASIQESIVSADALNWFEQHWSIEPFLPRDFNDALKLKGEMFGIFLPLETPTGRKEYLFKFVIEDVRIER